MNVETNTGTEPVESPNALQEEQGPQGIWLRRERIAIVLALCALGTNMVFRFYDNAYASKALRISEQADQASRNTERLVVAMLDAETGQRGYLLTSQPSFLLPFENTIQALPSVTADFRSAVDRLPVDRSKANTIERLASEKLAELKATIKLKRTSDSAALRIVNEGTGDRLMRELRTTGAELVANYQTYANSERRAAEKHQRFTLITTTVGTIVAGAILLLTGQRLSHSSLEQQKLFRQIHERELQYQKLADRLQMVREEERAYLAREIHDVLGQSFTGIKLDLGVVARKLESGDSQNAVQILKQGAAAVDDSIRLLRKIATELRPPLLDHIGLAAAIGAYAKEFANRMGIQVELNLTRETIALNPDEGIALYRIFQESLTNVARHANAAKVSVSLRSGSGLVSLRVQDDGRGFDTKRCSTSLGLLGIEERARLIGAEFFLSSEVGKGTTVGADLPSVRRA